MALGNGGDNATFDGFVGQFAWCPVADGALRGGGGLTSQCHDLAPLLDSEGGRRPRTRGILQPFEYGTMRTRQPVASPAPYRKATGPQETRDLVGIVPVRKVQNNLGPEAEVLGCFMGTDEGEELLAFVLRNEHIGRFGTRHRRLHSAHDMKAEDGVSFYRNQAVA